MATLNSLFVSVNKDDCSSFRSIYVSPSGDTTRSTDYDTKIVFLKDKQEIFTQGTLFGLNNSDEVSALSSLIGTLPKRPATETEAERDYTSVVEYIQEMATGQAEVSTKLSASITVAGGPLADDASDNWPTDASWNVNGTRVIPAGTTFEEIFRKLFLLEKYGTLSGPVYTWSPSLSKPTVSIKNAAGTSTVTDVPVGTEVTLNVTTGSTVNGKKAVATVSGATYGYSLDGTNLSSSSSSYSQSSTDCSVSANIVTTENWTGNTAEVTEDDVTVKHYYVLSGTNTLSASESGVTVVPGTFSEQAVYSMTNVNTVKTSEVKTINETGFESSSAYAASKELTSSSSVTVNGYYPVYFGGVSNTELSDSAITADLVKSLSSQKAQPTSISIPSGTGSLLLAVKGSTATTITTVTSGNYSFGTSHYVDVDIPMLNNVETVKYRVFYVTNTGTTGNADTIKVSLS